MGGSYRKEINVSTTTELQSKAKNTKEQHITHISILTLHISAVDILIKRYRVIIWIKKNDESAYCLEEITV